MILVSNVRGCVGLFLILAFAGSVSWWSSKEESSVSSHVQSEVIKLVPLFHVDPSFINDIIINPIIEPTLANSLSAVYSKSKEVGVDFAVVVTDGDDDEYGDGTATHVAVFHINEEKIAGLRIICNSDTGPLVIAGAWTQ
jgi:hypothetical protein